MSDPTSTSAESRPRNGDETHVSSSQPQNPEHGNVDVEPPPYTLRHVGEKPSASDGIGEGLVTWDEPAETDPLNPLAWSNRRKWSNIGVLSFAAFLTPLASAMMAPAVPDIMQSLHETSTFFATFVVSIFVLGFAAGPLLVAPLGEVYGRVIVYNVCNVLFLVFTIMAANARDSGMLLAVRFWAGLAGVAPITCGGASIAEMLPREQRGRAMAIWSVGPLLGPVIGPIVGGYLVAATSWRWVFWLIAILAGVLAIAGFFLLNETYPPVILARKAARLRKSTGNPHLRSQLATDKSTAGVLREAVKRPLAMYLTQPIIAAICTYVALIYGAVYFLYTTFTFVFEEQYNFSTGAVGLSYLGSAVGSFIGLIYAGILSDRTIKAVQASGETVGPEHRLPWTLTIPGAVTIPAGFFIYGWSAQYKVLWIVPEIGTALIGFGMLLIFMCAQTYLVDAYTIHAASALAANNVLRNVLGGVLPLFALKLYDAIGLGWGNSVLAFVLLVFVPVLPLIRVYAARTRQGRDSAA